MTAAIALSTSDSSGRASASNRSAVNGGNDQSKINSIRAAGGDVVVSFGGWDGNKLGEKCSSASALAGAYQKVINAYKLKAIDIDIENTEFGSSTVRQRVISALKTVQNNNPGLNIYVTFGTTTSGPDGNGVDLIKKGKAAGLTVTGWTIMPFDFGSHSGSMGSVTKTAADGLKNAVKSAYGYSDTTAYAHIGISSMNGKTDESDETVSTSDFNTILSYAKSHHIARFTFWSVNRDRQCGSGSDADSCSGISQTAYAFTKIVAQYHG